MLKRIILLVFISVLMFSLSALAGDWEAVGGVTQNSLENEFNLNVEIDLPEEDITPSVVEPDQLLNLDLDLTTGDYSGQGYYVGGRYWFNDVLACGFGYENVNSDYYVNFTLNDLDIFIPPFLMYEDLNGELELGANANFSGPYAELVYKVNDFLRLNGSAGKYAYTLDGYFEIEDENGKIELLSGDGYGYIVGAEMEYPFKNDFSFIASAGYRFMNFSMDKIGEEKIPEEVKIDLGVKGLRFGAGISYSF